MKKELRLQIVTYFVITYMLLAFTWWAILLFRKNEAIYTAKIELLKVQKTKDNNLLSEYELHQMPEYIKATNEYGRQEWMVLGEAIVFVISLIIGVWLINRAYNREILAANQRRNFLLSITHELKSPIASIRLALETFLKRSLKKEQSDKISHNALKETKRLHQLVDDLLLAARMDMAYQPVAEPIPMGKLVLEIIDKNKQKYTNANILFSEPTSEIYLFADRLGITTIVLNLIENAIKYSFDKPNIEVHLREKGENVYFKVIDEGVGIKGKDKKRVFNRFYRVGNESTRTSKGTGLGLYIVNEMIKKHGGRIRIEDNKPQGSIFKVILPKKHLDTK